MSRMLFARFTLHGGVLTATSLLLQFWSPQPLAQSTVEIGVGYNSEDSYQLGQYTGLTQSGGFGIGGFSLQGQASENRYWRAKGKNLGIEARSLAAEYGRRGSYSISLSYEQLPHYRFNDGRTPFNGSGSLLQTLPTDWVGANSTSGFSVLPANLNQVNIDTRRERFTGTFEWQLNPEWQLHSEYRHEIKQGSETLGSIFALHGGNPRGSVLLRPIDFQTDEFNIALSYSNATTQYTFGYNAMLFSNKDSALRFSNPFNHSQWSSGANFSDGAVGQIALEPDNNSNQFSFSGVHRLSDATRLSGSVVSSRLEQDDSYLPYSSVFPSTTPLPRTDLDGRVDSLVASLNLSTRLNRRSTLRLRYNYRERDNKSPQDIYLRVVNDSVPQASLVSSQARVNRIYDLERNRISADLNYRMSGKTQLAAGYEFEDTDRTMVDVATTEENTGFVKLKFTPWATSRAWIKLSRSQREASEYISTVPFVAGHNPDYVATLMGDQLFENDPLLRRFHLTDRDRDELSASLSLFPTEVIGVNFLVLIADDKYPDAKVGLQESDKGSFSTDLSYTPAANWSSSLYYNYETYRNQQAGFARLGGGNPTPFYPESVRNPANNWSMDSEDNVHTIGAGIEWELMAGRLDLSVDANYTDAATETRPHTSGQPFQVFPDITTQITTLSLDGSYQMNPGRVLSLGYRYQRFESADWALDNATVNTLSNIMLLGYQSPQYSAHIFQASVVIDL